MRDNDRQRFLALEDRLARLENQHEKLRDFVIPAFWNALDRLEERAPNDDPVSCLACGHGNQKSAFATRIDDCMFGGGRLERLECPKCGCVFGPLKYLQSPDALVSADYSLLYSY